MAALSVSSSVYSYRDGVFTMLRRVPVSIFRSIAEYFRRDLTKEAVVQVWCRDTGYYIVYPSWEISTKGDIRYQFPWDSEGEYVCCIHSHNTMPAFWSSIDDADEKFFPGLYGVFGNLDRERISVKFRFCPGDGDSIPLDMWDIAYNG